MFILTLKTNHLSKQTQLNNAMKTGWEETKELSGSQVTEWRFEQYLQSAPSWLMFNILAWHIIGQFITGHNSWCNRESPEPCLNLPLEDGLQNDANTYWWKTWMHRRTAYTGWLLHNELTQWFCAHPRRWLHFHLPSHLVRIPVQRQQQCTTWRFSCTNMNHLDTSQCTWTDILCTSEES